MLDPPRGARRAQPTRPAGWPRPSAAERGRGVHSRPPAAPSPAQAQQDERWSPEWMETRRRQRRARFAVAVGLAAAAGMTVVALITVGSPPDSGTPSSIPPASGPTAIGTAGLVPVPQSPPTTP